ncbi:MAG TPA: hypothetical protein ENJ30_00800 [Desulfobulbaceae bacterium]|nr:hypothetical protein [Desulfobulbaceae bacterium]
MDKKNITIGVLAGLVILGSLWGSVGNRNSKVLRQELEDMKAKLASVQVVSSRSHEAVLTKTAALQKELQQCETQVEKARNELITLRKANKSLEARLSERDAAVQKLKAQAKQLVAQKQQLAAQAQGAASRQLTALQKKAGALQARIVTLQNALKGKDQQIAKMQQAMASQLAALKKENGSLKAGLKKLSAQAAKKVSATQTAQVTALQKKITELQAEIKQKDTQISELQAAMKKMQTAMATMKQSATTKVAPKEQQEPTVVVVEEADRSSDDAAAAGGGCAELEKAKAQIIGLEKMVEEKNATIEEISRELDRVKINMDVLLAKISDQQDALQEVQVENSELVKELAAKNEECADLQEQLHKAPLQ